MREKVLAPHQQRVVDEKSDLDENRKRLGEFKNGNIFPTLHWEDQELLNTQAHLMTMLSGVLGARISRF